MNAIRAPPGLRRGHKTIPCTKKDAHAEQHGPFARPSSMVRGVHRKSRRHRSARARTRFSRLRFVTPYESGIRVKEVQYFIELTSQKTEIAKYACEPR